MQSSILVLNGPNLNLLGQRETGIYGQLTLADVGERCRALGRKLGFEVAFEQSNHEGQLVDWIHAARGRDAAIVINAGAYSHTSLALHDALRAYEGIIIEVHLSNIYKREPIRHHSYISAVAHGVICGLGEHGYRLAIEAAAELVDAAKREREKV